MSDTHRITIDTSVIRKDIITTNTAICAIALAIMEQPNIDKDRFVKNLEAGLAGLSSVGEINTALLDQLIVLVKEYRNETRAG